VPPTSRSGLAIAMVSPEIFRDFALATSAIGTQRPLAPRRAPTLVRRPRTQRCMARRLHRHVSRTRSRQPRHQDSRDFDAALLDHGGPRPRPDVERRRAEPGARHLTTNRAQLPRRTDRRARGAATSTMAREHLEAPVNATEGVCARLGSPTPATRRLRPNLPLLGHPEVGASREGFVIEQLLTLLDSRDPSFWRTRAGAELDLRVEVEGKRRGLEIKLSDQPEISPPSSTSSDHRALRRRSMCGNLEPQYCSWRAPRLTMSSESPVSTNVPNRCATMARWASTTSDVPVAPRRRPTDIDSSSGWTSN